MPQTESVRKGDDSDVGLTWNQSSAAGRLPFSSFAELRAAISNRSFNVGVDSLAAARWSDSAGSLARRLVITLLSLMLVAAALASLIVAFLVENYWLLAAAPIQCIVFYLSDSGHAWRNWATVGGVASVVVFMNLLLNHLPTAAVLTAYAGLTFAAVRAAGFAMNSAFRKALLSSEELFLIAYENGACRLQEKSNGRVYGVANSDGNSR